MDGLIPMFERQSGYRIKLIAAGTGQILTMGARGDADVVLCHAPELEQEYMAEGAFVNRRLVMYNDFVVVGPPTAPLKIKALRHLGDAFRRIAEAKAAFVSDAAQKLIAQYGVDKFGQPLFFPAAGQREDQLSSPRD